MIGSWVPSPEKGSTRITLECEVKGFFSKYSWISWGVGDAIIVEEFVDEEEEEYY